MLLDIRMEMIKDLFAGYMTYCMRKTLFPFLLCPRVKLREFLIHF